MCRVRSTRRFNGSYNAGGMIHAFISMRWLLIVFFVYVAALMKPEQEGKWENLLQSWLDTVTSRQEGSYAKVTALARSVSGWSESFIARLFGQRLFSPRAFGVSFFYGLASFFLTLLLTPLLQMLPHRLNTQPALARGMVQPSFLSIFLLFGFFVLIGSIPALVGEEAIVWTWVFWLVLLATWAAPLITLLTIMQHLWGYYSALRFILGICLLCGLNFLLDIMFLRTTRWALRLASNARQLAGVLAAIVLDVVLGYAVIVGPILLGVRFVTTFHAGNISIAPMLVFAFKTIDFLIALIVLVVLTLIGLHAVLWFVLERPIFSCLRFKVIREKRLLWTFAGILYAAPHVGFLKALFKAG